MSGNLRYATFTSNDARGLHLVQPCAQNGDYTCDIFIVHGLNGGAARTWRHPTSQAIWFRDFLPGNLKDDGDETDARIWTYGYRADATFSTRASDMDPEEFAQDLLTRVSDARLGREEAHKIIWICHSLGGIVVKNALVHAFRDPEHASIWSSTVGIVFMGTPHQGSSLANVGGALAQIAKACGVSVNTSLLRHLKSDCMSLATTASEFAKIASHIKIYSLYEIVPQFGSSRVVDKESAKLKNLNDTTAAATLSTISETMIPLNSNHRDMGKYRSYDDQNYALLRSCINRLMMLTHPRRRTSNVFSHHSQQIERFPSSPTYINSNGSDISPRTSSTQEAESNENETPPLSIRIIQTHMHIPEPPPEENLTNQVPSSTAEDFKDLVLRGDVAPVKSFIEAIPDADQVLQYRTIALRSSLDIVDGIKRYKMFNAFLDPQTAELPGPDLDGNALAHRIIKQRDCDTTYLRALVLTGVDMNSEEVKNGKGYRPLHVATLFTRLDMVRFLLEQTHVPVNTEDANKHTPLWHAIKTLGASEAKMSIVELLLAHGGDKAPEPTNNCFEHRLNKLFKKYKFKKIKGTDLYCRR